MDYTVSLRATVAVALAAAFVSACDRQATTEAERSVEKAGQRIDKAIDRAGQKLAEASDKVTTSVKEAVTPATTTVTTGATSSVTGLPAQTRAALGDTAITASIKTDFLKDPDLSVLKIDVDTHDGVVTLNGLAENEAARGRAEKLAGSIKGVRGVRNYLMVKRG
jgi:osmotically-inducible protein OsmY